MQETLHTLGIDWDKLIAQTVSFGVLLWVLWRFAYKPVLDILEKRRVKIEESLANAEKIKQEKARTELEKREVLLKANEQAVQILAEAQKTASAQSEKKIQETIAQAEAMIKKAEAAIDLERDKMMLELKREIARLVVETSAKVTGKILTQDDHNRLNQETLKHLAA
ncbi:MAG: F0F1 ATP synthase subunit B [Verrucomicrobiota bacterium]